MQPSKHGCSARVRYDTTVVLYGRDTTAAARAAVLFMYAGVDDVRILDGGFVAWSAAGYPIATTATRPQPVTDFGKTFPGHPEYLMATEAVKTLIAERDAALVSVRSWAEYTGVTSGYSYIQPKGRIAGDVWGHAGSAPCAWTIIVTLTIPCVTIMTSLTSGVHGVSLRTNASRFVVRDGAPVRHSSTPI